MPSSSTSTVFIGGAFSMDALMNPAISSQMLADNVSLYGHVNGVWSMVYYGEMKTLVSDWSGSAPGVAELGEDLGSATGTVTLQNSTAASVTLGAGALFATASGLEYQVVAYPGQPGITTVGQTGSNGYTWLPQAANASYTVNPGQSVTLQVEAMGYGPTYNIAANGLLAQGSLSGLTLTASSAMTGGMGWTNPAQNGVVGSQPNDGSFLSTNGGDIDGLFHNQGYVPSEANVNLSSDAAWTNQDLTAWKDYVDNARSQGVMNVAPIWSANGLDVDYSQNFATSPYFANVRQAALYGGGLSFDTPPWFFNHFTPAWFPIFHEDPNTYVNFIEQQVQWARSEGIRSSMIISPNVAVGEDPNFLADTKAMVARLEADNALPTQFIVENYGLTAHQQGIATNIASTTDPNSLNAVAAYLSTIALTPSVSESGLETPGVAAVDMIMNGIVPTVALSAAHPSTPYANAVVATGVNNPSLPNTSVITLTVTASSGVKLQGDGTVSADGLQDRFVGTAAQVQQALHDLVVTDTASQSSSGSLTVSLQDASGTASGTTALTMEAVPPPPSLYNATLGSGSVSIAATAYTGVAFGPGITDGMLLINANSATGAIVIMVAGTQDAVTLQGALSSTGGLQLQFSDGTTRTLVAPGGSGASVVGGAGNDTFAAGVGSGLFDGGSGKNSINFTNAQAPQGVVVDMAHGIASGWGGQDGFTNIQRVVLGASSALVLGGSGPVTVAGSSGMSSILGASGGLTYVGSNETQGVRHGATVVGGTNALMLGAGTDSVVLTGGATTVTTGSGPAMIMVQAASPGSITAGTLIQVGAGNTTINAVVGAQAPGTSVVGGQGTLYMSNGAAASTVVGGQGAATVFAGQGGGVYTSGLGAIHLVAGLGSQVFSSSAQGSYYDGTQEGSATTNTLNVTGGSLIGVLGAGVDHVSITGGTAQVTLGSAQDQVVVAGHANVSLHGGHASAVIDASQDLGRLLYSASSGSDTILVGAGGITANIGSGQHLFVLPTLAQMGGGDTITGMTGRDHLQLRQANGTAATSAQIQTVLGSAQATNGGMQYTLLDHTQLTVTGTALTQGSFGLA